MSAHGIGLREETPRSAPRRLRVTGLERLGPRLLRVKLGGELEGFPRGAEGSHLKLFFKRPGQHTLHLPTLGPEGVRWPEPALKPIARTYTVAAFDAASETLSVDFVLHGDEGPATHWATHATVGEELGIAGPGGPNPMLAPAERYLLAGDLTALPAIAALTSLLPADARADVLIEAAELEDMLPLARPGGVRVRWLFRKPHAPSGLLDAVRAMAIRAEGTFAFLAGENGAVLALRDHLLHERGFSKRQLYATPYWREQQTEEQYHQERHRIMDELAEAAR
jgi:NADPH-dependent ferric siderophore reductase